MTKYEDATEEFENMAWELYEKHQNTVGLTVEPSLIMFLRSPDSRKKAYAYAKLVEDEYQLLTDKKFIIVIVDKHFNTLQSDKERKYVILHEMKHLRKDNDKYKLVKHDLEGFKDLIINPEWDLSLVEEPIE